jgi:hypothetical protein
MYRFAAWFSILTGSAMLAMWPAFFASGAVPETESAPVALAFHLGAETMTAVTLIVAGVGLARAARWGPTAYLVGTGMLLYTVVASPGEFVERGEYAFVAMFAALVVFAVVGLRSIARASVAGGD